MKTTIALLSFVSFLLAGCGTIDVDVTSWERSTLLASASKVPDVRLSAQMLSHNDSAVFLSTTYVIPSEKIFRSVFTGNEDSPASLDLVSAALTKNDFNLTDRLVVKYRIETVLRMPGGERHTLIATAESTKLSFDGAMREAIEKATLDLATQCRASLGRL